MARNNAYGDRLIPFNMQPGRIEEFLDGVKEAHEQGTKTALLAAGLALTPMAWSSFSKYMKSH